MAATNQEIITQATQIAKCPGYLTQAAVAYNAILDELAQTYDFDIARGTYVFNFDPSITGSASLYPNVQPGGGPYPLPSDFLRMYGNEWFLLGVPYPMIPCDLSEYDQFVQQAGLSSYPVIFATDMSQSPPNLLIWPPASGAYQCQVRYRKQMPSITTPQTSTASPWFPFTNYLVTRLAGELMKITGDDRADTYLGDSPGGAQGILNRILKMVNDKGDRSQSVKLDRRRFSRPFTRLPNTKNVGWVVNLFFCSTVALQALGV